MHEASESCETNTRKWIGEHKDKENAYSRRGENMYLPNNLKLRM